MAIWGDLQGECNVTVVYGVHVCMLISPHSDHVTGY